MPSILVIEDDPELVTLLSDYLTRNGFTVTAHAHGVGAADRIVSERPDLVLLDLMLPGVNGLDVCRAVRATRIGAQIPILVLTALGDEVDEIVGLEVGADDYLAKPVRPRLLLARIRTLLRRVAEDEQDSPVLTHGPIRLDPKNRTAQLDGAALALPDAEFDLLAHLLAHPGEILDRDHILIALRGTPWDGLERSVDLRVSRLRNRLGAWGGLIKSVRGRGYLLADAP